MEEKKQTEIRRRLSKGKGKKKKKNKREEKRGTLDERWKRKSYKKWENVRRD